MKKEGRKQAEGERSEKWASNELAGIEGGDARAVKRLHAVVAGMHRSPGASIPEALGRWSEVKAAYRLASSGVFSGEEVLASHGEATVRRIRQAGVKEVLVAQDTTSLNYSGRKNTRGLGPISNNAEKTVGLFAHAQLCMRADSGAALGLLSAELWSRDPKAYKSGPAGGRNRKPIEQKESHRWLKGYQQAQGLAEELGREVTVISVADREGDIFEVFAQWQDNEAKRPVAAQLLIRAQHNRRLSEGEQRGQERVKAGPVQATMEVAVSRQAGRKARTAEVEVRFERVELQAPVNLQKYQNEHRRLTLSLIIASEPHPPQGEEALLWILWSSQPVRTPQDALKQLGHYSLRWQIEVFHRILKSGCETEHRQLETVERLKLFIAIDLMIAVYLLGLTHAARTHPQAPAHDWLSGEEQQALYCYIHKTRIAPDALPDLQTQVRWIGRLGGHLARKSDGPPGPQTLWRGLLRLQDITDSWLIFASPPPLPPTCG